MSARPPRPPANLQTLNRRITGLANELGRPVRRVQRAVANTVVGQMLPPGVVKGGTAVKLRVGEAASRFTPDLDTSPRAGLTLDEYVGEFQERLHGGWGGFTGTVETLEPAQPEGVPDDYVMRPYRLAVVFQSRHWLSVTLEVGHDEVGSTAHAEPRMAGDILVIFEKLVLPRPEPVPLMATHHQVAQKLHACTSQSPRTGRNDRAHDLVDLQILVDEEPSTWWPSASRRVGSSPLVGRTRGRRRWSRSRGGRTCTPTPRKIWTCCRRWIPRSRGRTSLSPASRKRHRAGGDGPFCRPYPGGRRIGSAVRAWSPGLPSWILKDGTGGRAGFSAIAMLAVLRGVQEGVQRGVHGRKRSGNLGKRHGGNRRGDGSWIFTSTHSGCK